MYESLCQDGERACAERDHDNHEMEHPQMPQAATTESLPDAFRMMKAMQAQGIEWGEDYRAAALKEVLEGRMAGAVDRRLSEMAARGEADRRNGSYRRWLMTELGEIELSVPRTRTWSVLEAVRTYARCAALPTVYPRIPVQRCWAHKIRTVPGKVHKAVACLRNGLDKLLTCWRYPSLEVEQHRLFHTGYEPDRIHLRHRSPAHREDQGLLVTQDGTHHGLQSCASRPPKSGAA